MGYGTIYLLINTFLLEEIKTINRLKIEDIMTNLFSKSDDELISIARSKGIDLEDYTIYDGKY